MVLHQKECQKEWNGYVNHDAEVKNRRQDTVSLGLEDDWKTGIRNGRSAAGSGSKPSEHSSQRLGAHDGEEFPHKVCQKADGADSSSQALVVNMEERE